MATDLQTVIVKKSHDGRERKKRHAEKIADEHAHRAIYTSRETAKSYRFRQRPPGDFVRGSFRTVRVGDGVSLVYGKLKRGLKPRLKEDRRRRNPDDGEHSGGIMPQDIIHFQSCLPDPGPCAWLGDVLEIEWIEVLGRMKYDSGKFTSEDGWMMLWSPRLKAVICMPKTSMEPSEDSDESTSSIVKRWGKRDPKGSAYCSIPAAELTEVGKAKHIIYRSDKWNEGTFHDYIHDFQEGVRCFTDNLEIPNLFVLCGGRLTVTERGLIY